LFFIKFSFCSDVSDSDDIMDKIRNKRIDKKFIYLYHTLKILLPEVSFHKEKVTFLK